MLLTLALAFAADPAPPILPDARFALALYCNPTCDDAVLDALDQALAPLSSVDEFSDHVAVPSRVMGIAGADFGIPDAEFIEEFGQGIADPALLGASQEVVLVWFAGPREQSLDTLAAAHGAFLAAARAAGGWVEDLDTQRLYGPDAWAALDPHGALQDWFVVDSSATEDPARVRVVTRGLRRFGDFDLVVPSVATEGLGDIGWALDAIAETLHPRTEVRPDEPIDTAAARGVAHFSLVEPGDDDPAPPLLAVRFDGQITVESGPVVAAEVEVVTPEAPVPVASPDPAPSPATVATVVASEPARVAPAPSAAPAPPPTSLAEARRAVQHDLAELEHRFSEGLPTGDRIAVSAPFTTRQGGTEYLWVEVNRWSGDEVRGTLATEPSAVEGLHAGDGVVVPQDRLYDYVYRHADGTKTGNLTRPFR